MRRGRRRRRGRRAGARPRPGRTDSSPAPRRPGSRPSRCSGRGRLAPAIADQQIEVAVGVEVGETRDRDGVLRQTRPKGFVCAVASAGAAALPVFAKKRMPSKRRRRGRRRRRRRCPRTLAPGDRGCTEWRCRRTGSRAGTAGRSATAGSAIRRPGKERRRESELLPGLRDAPPRRAVGAAHAPQPRQLEARLAQEPAGGFGRHVGDCPPRAPPASIAARKRGPTPPSAASRAGASRRRGWPRWARAGPRRRRAPRARAGCTR